jgi:hypothetical protein
MYTKETLAKLAPAVQRRIRIERRLVLATVDALLAAGYVLGVDDGGAEMAAARGSDRAAIVDALMNTDDDTLCAWRVPAAEDRDDDPRPDCAVRFIYGNSGFDVVSDYSCSLESVLAPVFAMATRLEMGLPGKPRARADAAPAAAKVGA